LTIALLIAKMARVAINKRRMKKKRQKICGSLSQPVLLSPTTYSFGNKDDRKYSNFVKACANFLFRSAASFSTIKQQYKQ
jgi:hypothetical protein